MIRNESYIKFVKSELLNNNFGMNDEEVVEKYIQSFDDDTPIKDIKDEFNETFEPICNAGEERKEKILKSIKKTDSIFDYAIVEFAVDNFPKFMHPKFMHGRTLYMFALIDSVDDLYYVGFDEDYEIHFVTACAILEEDKKNSFKINKKEISNIKKDFESKLEETDKLLYMNI